MVPEIVCVDKLPEANVQVTERELFVRHVSLSSNV